MSLINKYQNIKLRNKLITNLGIIFTIYSIIIVLIYFYLNETFKYIDNSELLIENYTALNKNSYSYDNIQNYISESIISLSIDDQKWKKLVEPASKNLFIVENYIHKRNDSINHKNAKQNFEIILNLYKNEITPKIISIKKIITDTTYTDFSINSELSVLLTEVNTNFTKLNASLANIKKDSINEILEVYTQISTKKNTIFIILILSVIPFFLFLTLFYFIFKNIIIVQIEKLIFTLQDIALGDISAKITNLSNDEMGKIRKVLFNMLSGLNKITAFAKEIENGNFESEFKPRSKKDELGIALIDMRGSLKKAKQKELENQKEDEKRNWAANEITKYGDILRKNNNELSKLADAIIQSLINTLDANQGGLFVLNDDNPNNKVLELTASYAFDRKKFHEKTINLGEGLVGTCAVEKDTVYLKEIPEDYIEIISGLGTSNPRNLILVPLKLENKILGVVELASFYEFEKHKVEFLEKVAENIAATIATTKINSKTALLLGQSQQQAEELASQEEEMRQNMEELQATQEEAARQAVELQGVFDAINENTGTIEFSPEGIISDANEYILKLLRIKMSFIDQKHHSTIISVEEKNSDEFYSFWQEIRSGKTKMLVRRYFVAQKELWLQETFKPLYDSNGKLHKVLAMYSNITTSEVQKKELKLQSEKRLSYQNKMKINQAELQKTNQTLESREGILQKALEKAKKVEEELNVKNELMATQEAELIENLENLAITQEEMEMQTKMLTQKNKTTEREKNRMNRELNKSLEKQEELTKEIEILKKEK